MRSFKLLLPLVAAGLIAGCASTSHSEMDSMRTMAQDAMERANAAAAKADQASRDAAMAMEAAKKAQACCEANTQRINRAFEDSMRK
ncbi:Lpp/OprI family alanine-zipper lipoprotein [Marinobacterium arenosum]|uniref:Lpp/OprI family alanine-zipper lipoprotein n=1 Tax=Marinobacterium arenosum TaxID=2862496 RepID=UPI001C97A71C|nr:Lpp/OprI family alanine-zipper lipoprotein [Marinobacterium arenosum]MBY4676276.1 hypothetical protein [Marinobacterium arenosum]